MKRSHAESLPDFQFSGRQLKKGTGGGFIHRLLGTEAHRLSLMTLQETWVDK